jgi:deazaflavin-dependent oxidoreductase (nitroreductase family)
MSRRPKTKPIRDAWQRHIGNRVIRQLLEIGVAPRVYALLETTGRKTGQRRRTPVGNGMEAESDTFWLISEHGMRAAYVRNIQADPRIRLKVNRRWRTGTAHILQEDDALKRLRQTGRYNASAVRFFGNPEELVTVRIDLDPSEAR